MNIIFYPYCFWYLVITIKQTVIIFSTFFPSSSSRSFSLCFSISLDRSVITGKRNENLTKRIAWNNIWVRWSVNTINQTSVAHKMKTIFTGDFQSLWHNYVSRSFRIFRRRLKTATFVSLLYRGLGHCYLLPYNQAQTSLWIVLKPKPKF